MLDEKPLNQLTETDLQNLVTSGVSESRFIEFKRDLYGAKDEETKELLKDVSAFANTQGGTILIGVDESDGVASAILGVLIQDKDAETLRLTSKIRGGIDPKFDFEIYAIPLANRNFVIAIRVLESLAAPHRVTFKNHSQFYSRHSAGVTCMDVDELRSAFLLSQSVTNRIQDFRRERVEAIIGLEPPLPLTMGPKLCMHLIPISSFRSRQVFDLTSRKSWASLFPPPLSGSPASRPSFDGILIYETTTKDSRYSSYCQLYRSGIVECITDAITYQSGNGERTLVPQFYEQILSPETYLGDTLNSMRKLGVQGPIWLLLTLIEVKNWKLFCQHTSLSPQGINRHNLYLPEVEIKSDGSDYMNLLNPILDLVWNAGGLEPPNRDRRSRSQ